MELETVNKLYLELGQFTTAISRREYRYYECLKMLIGPIEKGDLPPQPAINIARGLLALGDMNTKQ